MSRSLGFVHWSGLAAIAGGVLWSLFAILASAKPVGCVATTCAQRPMRYTTDLAPLMIGAVLLLLVGLAGLLLRARLLGRFGRTLKTGVALAGAGAAVLAIALTVQAVFYAGDFPAMPTLVIPGGVALAAGMLLLGVAVLRLMPRWVGALLVIGAVAIVLGNDQDARVLLYVPFGVAWMAVGYELWRGASDRGTDLAGEAGQA